MIWWLRHVRKLTYLVDIVVMLGLFAWVSVNYSGEALQLLKLEQYCAFAALIFLYAALLISPLYDAFPRLPGKPLLVKARQALGVTAFSFGLLHATLTFFWQLGGFPGLLFLSNRYLLAISLSFTALCILAVMAATTPQSIHTRLGIWWKRIHRLVYAAGILIVIHALLLGTHYADLTALIPTISFAALTFLSLLELLRLDRFLRLRVAGWPAVGPVFAVGCASFGAAAFYLLIPASTSGPSFGIHAQHIQLAQQAQQNTTVVSNIPGLTGDKTKRYSVALDHPATVTANQPTTISFRVNDASSGNPTQVFQTVYEKQAHLIVVDSQLEYFSHIHPTLSGSTFTIDATFPHDGVYHLYLDFQPFGAIEQQFGSTLTVGTGASTPSTQVPDTKMTKTFGTRSVTLSTPGPLKATDVSYGRQLMTFTLKDALTGTPLTNLQPYLSAYGHLVMINEQTYDYLHVHPNKLAVAGVAGGPTVEFLPLGIYGPIKPGTYRVFAQFNPNGQLFTANYTVKVEQ